MDFGCEEGGADGGLRFVWGDEGGFDKAVDEGGFADFLGAEDDEFGFEGRGEGVVVVVGGARHCGGGRLYFDATFVVYLGSLLPVVVLWSYGKCADRLWRTIVGDTHSAAVWRSLLVLFSWPYSAR